MPSAIDAVCCADNDYCDSHQDGILYETLPSRMHYQKSCSEPEKPVKYAYPCIGRHLLMGRDRGHLRHAHQIDHKGKQRKMKDPLGGLDAVR